MRVVIRLDSVFSEVVRRSCSQFLRKLKKESSPEPALLKLSQVRQEIHFSGDLDENCGYSALSGLFTTVFSQVMGADDRLSWRAVLDQDNLTDSAALQSHVYDRIVGPFLREREAVLNEHGHAVLDFWEAIGELCLWICQRLQTAADQGALRYDPHTASWRGAESFLAPSDHLCWEAEAPEWTSPVRISGLPDGIWRDAATGEWRIVEWRRLQAAPEDALTEACLYRCLLGEGTITIVSFRPKPSIQTYPEEQLRKVEPALKHLVARRAGVLPGQITAEPSQENRLLGRRLVAVLREFGPVVAMRGDPVEGPAFLRYTVLPDKGVRVRAILDKADDLQIQLGLPVTPLIHKSEGLLVIDIQRQDRQFISFNTIREALPTSQNNTKALAGVDLEGRPRFIDLAANENPHLLVAGTTGSGKTEWLRSALASLICTNTPDTLRLVLIDPKRTAFPDLRHSPYLWDSSSLINPPDQSAVEILQRLVEELESRYQLFQRYHCDTLSDLAARMSRPIPRIVCVCDEYSDLAAGRDQRREIEDRILRLGSRARSAGIHLIIAMQDPRRELLSPALKSNLGGRVCLKMANYYHSVMMLGERGAEQLLGKGDLLYKSIGEPIRLQAPHLTADERAELFQGPASAELQAAG